MTEQSAFNKKNIVDTALPPSGGILDELHLSPQMKRFLRENAKAMQIVAVCLVLALLAWTFYGNYSDKRQQKAAARLTSTLKVPDPGLRVQALEELVRDFSGTASGQWARLELGHIAFQDKHYDTALERYTAVLEDMDSDNPLMPLLRYNIAQTLEFRNEYAKALPIYQSLVEVDGLAVQVYPAMGRIYEIQGDTAAAVKMYEAYLSLIEGDDVAPSSAGQSMIKILIHDKLAKLKDLQEDTPVPPVQ